MSESQNTAWKMRMDVRSSKLIRMAVAMSATAPMPNAHSGFVTVVAASIRAWFPVAAPMVERAAEMPNGASSEPK